MRKTPGAREAVQFGSFSLDMGNRLLSRDGVEVALPPRAVGVLWLLVARAGQVVSRQELLDEVWKDAYVSDTSLAEAVSLVRQVLGDDPQQPAFIQTLPRRGYRFVASVTHERPALEALADAEPGAAAAGPIAGRLWTPWLPWIVFFVAGLAVGLAVMARARPAPTPPRGVVRFGIGLDADTTLALDGRPLAVTRSGDTLALAVRRAGTTRLVLRRLSSTALLEVPASDGASSPFFSPDGRFVAFFARGRLWQMPLPSGTPSLVAEAPAALGGTWTDDGAIVFASRWTGGLDIVPAAGGAVRSLTAPDLKLGDMRHAWPDAIDGTSSVVFSIAQTPDAIDGSRSAVVDTRSGGIRRLEAQATDVRPLPIGYVLLLAPGSASVAPVDPSWRMITGSTLTLPEVVRVDARGGGAAVAISSTGVHLAVEDTPPSPPHWMGAGMAMPGRAIAGLDSLADLAVASDGRRVAGIERYATRADLWVVDVERGVRTRIASAPRLASPAWSPDGTTMAFASSDGGPFRVSLARADGSATPRTVYSTRSALPSAWTPDGTAIVVTMVDPLRGFDIGIVPAMSGPAPSQAAGSPAGPPEGAGSGSASEHSEGVARDVVATTADEMNGTVSPDGRWIAYETDEAGQWGVAVRPLAATGATVVVAADGRAPSWVDANTLVFAGVDRLIRVRARASDVFEPGPPEPLDTMSGPLARGVTMDGRVLVRPIRAGETIGVTLEWYDDLGARLAASRPLPRSFR